MMGLQKSARHDRPCLRSASLSRESKTPVNRLMFAHERQEQDML
jgi:hypothetical protein